MAVKLRLTRMGRKKRPFYRVIAVDSRKRRDGSYIECVGTYNPLTNPATVDIDQEAALKWLANGAQPSDTVRSLLSRRGIMLAFDLKKRGASEEDIQIAVAKHLELHQDKADKFAADAERKEEEARKADERRRKEEEARKAAEAAAAAKAEEEAAAAEAAPEAEATPEGEAAAE